MKGTKLTPKEIKEIVILIQGKTKHEAIAEMFNVQPRTVTRLKNKWCKEKSRTKLTACEVAVIRKLLRMGVKQLRIAEIFGVEQTTVSNIKIRRTWRAIA